MDLGLASGATSRIGIAHILHGKTLALWTIPGFFVSLANGSCFKVGQQEKKLKQYKQKIIDANLIYINFYKQEARTEL